MNSQQLQQLRFEQAEFAWQRMRQQPPVGGARAPAVEQKNEVRDATAAETVLGFYGAYPRMLVLKCGRCDQDCFVAGSGQRQCSCGLIHTWSSTGGIPHPIYK